MQRILAVDDDIDILEVLQYILEDSGYEVGALSDGQYLFEKIDAFKPDLILLDLMLGGLDGRELCREIKAKKKLVDIPVILFSAGHNIGGLMHRKGAPDAFLEKPFELKELLDAIESNLPADNERRQYAAAV